MHYVKISNSVSSLNLNTLVQEEHIYNININTNCQYSIYMYLLSLVMQEIHSKKGRLTNYIYLKLWY